MLNNIFTSKIVNYDEYKIHTDDSLQYNNETTNFYEFFMLEEALLSEERLKMERSCYLGEITGDYEIVQESFESFCDSVVKFFKGMIENLKQWFGQLYSLIMISIGKGSEYFSQNKDIILRKKINITVSGNKFTYKEDIPKLKYVDDLIKEYNSEVSKIRSMKDHEIAKRREDFMNRLPAIRGELLGTKDKIPDGEFTSYCKKFFRDGEETSESIDVNQDIMRQMIERMPKAKKDLEECKKESKKILDQLHFLVKYFQDMKVKWKDGAEKSATLHELERKDDKISKVEDKSSSYDVSDTFHFKTVKEYLAFREAESKALESAYMTILHEKMNALKDEVDMHKKIMTKWTTTPEQGPEVVKSDDDGGKKDDK